jgi:hypothetical protein
MVSLFLKGGGLVNHEEYLKLMLKDKNLKLQHLHDEHRIAIAVYNAKREMFIDEIDSIEKQLHYDGK